MRSGNLVSACIPGGSKYLLLKIVRGVVPCFFVGDFMSSVRLSPRLMLVKSFIRRGDRVADIGTDHALLPVYLVESGISSSVIASDIGSGPLDSGRKTAAAAGVSDKIRFVQAPGLTGILPGEADTFVIAGMGGETISGIIEQCPWSLSERNRFILQPQSKVRELMEFCGNAGLQVQDAGIIRDAGRMYIAFSCALGQTGEGFIKEVFKLLREKRDPLLEEYKAHMQEKLRKRLSGLQTSFHCDSAETERICMEIEEINSL